MDELRGSPMKNRRRLHERMRLTRFDWPSEQSLVQMPEPGSFNSDVLTWFRDDAWIPKKRLNDWMRGEEGRPAHPCTFKIRATHDRQFTSGKCVVCYWCSYGSLDFRKRVHRNLTLTNVPKSGSGSRPLAQRWNLGTSTCRGCLCHFTVTYYKHSPTLCKIHRLQREHVDVKRMPCHGQVDPTARAANAIVAPKISRDLRNFVENLLRNRVQPTDILQEHKERIRKEVHSPGTVWSRDMALSLKDVLNIQQMLRRFDPGYAADDAVATLNWTKLNSEKILMYQIPSKKARRPFILAWQTNWMLGKLATLGHGSTISMDATFGTNKYGYQLYTVICFDAFQNGVPCMWFLMERHEADDLTAVLNEMKKKVNTYRMQTLQTPGEWRPSCFLTDDAKEENVALNEVFPGVPVNLCLWHVRRAWIKKLHSLVKDPFAKALMNGELGSIMYMVNEDPWQKSVDFMSKWREQRSFVQYYEKNWHSRITRWAKAYRNYPHSNQDSQGSIERWHATLKQYLRGSKKGKMSRRVVWLITMLTEKIEPFYYCAAELKQQGVIRNRIVAGLVLAAIRSAQKIPDINVIRMPAQNGTKVSLVASESRPSCLHEVMGWDTDLCSCTCGFAIQGNVCKHQIKCLLHAGYSEVELLHMLGIKWGTDAGGLQNVQPCDALGTVEIANLGLAASVLCGDESDHDQSEDCVILSATPGGDFYTPTDAEDVCPSSSKPRKVHSLADFERAIGRMYEEVCESPELCEHAYNFVTQAINQALTAKATKQLQKSTEQSTCPEPFTATAGNDRTLKRKKDFLEVFHTRRKRRQEQKAQMPEGVHRFDEDNRFKDVPTQKMTMQDELNKAAMAALAKQEEPSELVPRFNTSITSSNAKWQRECTQYKGIGSTNSGSNSTGTLSRGKAQCFPDVIILD
ncbi:hypothetical protein R1sor_017935 [Riccia sorocarpa]|uniref:SWIM-type domain-containing protein n=1 Tax=Riccia sorocarpa TaxID=122646 RepID=A0ABD3I888_9MARC